MVEKLSPNFFEIIDQINFIEYGFSHRKLLDVNSNLQFFEKDLKKKEEKTF